MSKKYQGQTCVYCSLRPATVVEHVFAKKFFTVSRRANLPTAPGCEECNTEKSKLETYLMGVMPFGGQHSDATAALAAAEPRLTKNQKLYRGLASGFKIKLGFKNGKIAPVVMTLPIEPGKVLQFYEYATKGLMFSHWNSSLLPEHKCKAHFLSRGGELRLDMLLNTKRTNKVHVNLGEGTYEYEAVQSQDAAELTVWKFSLQGGANLGAGPNELVGHVGVLTGNNELAESFVC